MEQMYRPPKLEENIICVTSRENYVLAALVSAFFNKPQHYFIVFIFPEVKAAFSKEAHMGEDNFVSKIIGRESKTLINNVLANLDFSYVVLAGLDNLQKTYFDFVAQRAKVIVDTIDEVADKLSFLGREFVGEIRCNREDLLQGLLLAKHTEKKLIYDPEAAGLHESQPEQNGLIVLEDNEDVTNVIAANYAFAVCANLVSVEKFDRHSDLQDVQKLIYEWRKTGDAIFFQQLAEKINQRIGSIDFSKYQYATFFTDGLPYSLVVGDKIPVSYVNLSLRSDFFIFNSISYEYRPHFQGAIVFSPEEFDDEETPNVISSLNGEGFYVKELTGKKATVRNFGNYVEHYPYDILHICSHGGETDGYYVVEKFVDRKGKEHEVTYEEVVGFSPLPGKMVEVHRKAIFRSFDGLGWMSPELKGQKIPSYVFEDMRKALFSCRLNGNTVREKTDHPILSSCHVKCYKSIHQGMFHILASHSSPVVFNNTCSSWYEISTFFLSKGGRGYIGTLWPIKNTTAVEAANHFYSRVVGKNVLSAFQLMNESIKGTVDNGVYIFWGLHFTSIQKPEGLGKKRILRELLRAGSEWARYIQETPMADTREKGLNILRFLHNEITNDFTNEDLRELEKELGRRGIPLERRRERKGKDDYLQRGVIDFPSEIRRREK